VDRFVIFDAATHGAPSSNVIRTLEDEIRNYLKSPEDTTLLIPSPFCRKPAVSITNTASRDYTVIEVELKEEHKPGALYQIARAIYTLGLNINAARVGMDPGRGVNIFYVNRRDGTKISDKDLHEIYKELNKLLTLSRAPEIISMDCNGNGPVR